jgi:uncharacterized lipoprotein YbaY
LFIAKVVEKKLVRVDEISDFPSKDRANDNVEGGWPVRFMLAFDKAIHRNMRFWLDAAPT